MTLDTRVFAGFVLAVSAVVLATAFAAQYWGGLAPCELCILERWPWTAAIVIALVALFVGGRPALAPVAALLFLAFAIGAGIAVYHVGVEQHWYPGPSGCTASNSAQTVEELRRQILGTAPVLCDEVRWSLFGVSLAGWNALASLLMAAIAAWAFLRRRRRPLVRLRRAA